jgi:hypothetical protein
MLLKRIELLFLDRKTNFHETLRVQEKQEEYNRMLRIRESLMKIEELVQKIRS